mmetsp:Transcript_2253/g.4157  ORF Transcript_2253/g.4157 Transcript_2253/m.4157 type:complete len:219 (+) Transcript_2253:924-1580(+)
MSTVFQEDRTIFITGSLYSVHISNFPTHVRNKNMFAVWMCCKLLFQISNIHDVIIIAFNVNCLSTGMFNGRRNSSECKSIGNNFSSRLETTCFQKKHQCRTTRIEGNAVFMSSISCHVDLGLGHNRFFTLSNVITIHSSSLHELKCSLLSLKRHRVRSLDVSSYYSSFVKKIRQENQTSMVRINDDITIDKYKMIISPFMSLFYTVMNFSPMTRREHI